jgi:hypothetical protein
VEFVHALRFYSAPSSSRSASFRSRWDIQLDQLRRVIRHDARVWVRHGAAGWACLAVEGVFGVEAAGFDRRAAGVLVAVFFLTLAFFVAFFLLVADVDGELDRRRALDEAALVVFFLVVADFLRTLVGRFGPRAPLELLMASPLSIPRKDRPVAAPACAGSSRHPATPVHPIRTGRRVRRHGVR